MQTQISSKASNRFRIYSGLLLFVLHLGNLSVSLLHSFELSRSRQQDPFSGSVEIWSEQGSFIHDKDSCSICLNSFFNQFFESTEQTSCSNISADYYDVGFVSLLLKKENYCKNRQPRAPPKVFEIIWIAVKKALSKKQSTNHKNSRRFRWFLFLW